MLMKIVHINHSLNCTILNLQFVPVRRLYRLRVNRFSKPGTSSSFAATLSRPLKHWTIRYLERTSGHNEAALRKHGRSLKRQHVKTINFVSNANLCGKTGTTYSAQRLGEVHGHQSWQSCQGFFYYNLEIRATQPPVQSVRLLFPSS
jgi:hypothetical protein